MEEIKITQTDKGFFVEQGNKQAEQLCWNEMLGTVAALTMPDPNLCLQWMKKKEKPYTPKDGDFVTAYNRRVLICRNPIVNKDYIGYDFDTYASLELHSKYLSISDPHYIEQLDIRPASEEEKQILLDALHKVGKEWDAEKKKVIKYKWKPKYGEDYFTLEFKRSKGGFYVLKTRWTDEPDDMLNLAFNLVFRTKEGAQKKVDKFNERLKQ